MIITKLISKNEIHLIETILKTNPKKGNKDVLSSVQIEQILNDYEKNIQNKTLEISVSINNGYPINMYTGYMYKPAATWVLAGPRVSTTNNSYLQTAKESSQALDLLIEHMENQLLLKFYQIDPGNRHLTRKKIMDRFSKKLSNYATIDEVLIPSNKESGFTFFDNLGALTVGKVERMIRLFYLKQEHRTPLILDFYKKIQ